MKLWTISNLFTRHTKMPSTYKKDKPWDTDDIDKWKVCQSQRHFQIFILQR